MLIGEERILIWLKEWWDVDWGREDVDLIEGMMMSI